MPEKALKKLNNFILSQWKVCFFAAFLTGLFAHFYKIVNWLPNWDSLVFRYDSQNMIALGRWFLPVVTSFSSFYDLPFLNGILAIIFHALSAVCICRMFDVKKKITAALIGSVIVSFHSVTSVMMYNYVADGYSISFFLATLAAMFMTDKKPKYLIAAILIALSTGIYQAYLTVTIMLVLFKLIDKALFCGEELSTILKKSIHLLFTGILGVAIYSIILKIILTLFSTKLLDYQGVNATASLAGIDLLSSLYVVKETFCNVFFDLSQGVNVYTFLNVLIMFFTITYYLKSIINNKIHKKPSRILIILVLSILLPLGASALAFINPNVDYHNLMRMGYSVFYLFFIIIYERGTEKTERNTEVKCWIVFVTTLALVCNLIVISNVSYHKAQISYEKSFGTLVRITDRIEMLPESEKCDKILVIGSIDNSEKYSVNLAPEITGITDGYIIRADDETVGQSVLCSALNDYCGKTYKFISGSEKEQLLKRQEVKSMSCWPEENCMKVVEDIIIIKLGTEGEK